MLVSLYQFRPVVCSWFVFKNFASKLSSSPPPLRVFKYHMVLMSGETHSPLFSETSTRWLGTYTKTQQHPHTHNMTWTMRIHRKLNMLADTDGHQGGAAKMQMHGFEIANHPTPHPKEKKLHILWSNSHAQAHPLHSLKATPGNTHTQFTPKQMSLLFFCFSLKKSSLSRFCAQHSPVMQLLRVMVCLKQVLHLQIHTAPFTMKPQCWDYTK